MFVFYSQPESMQSKWIFKQLPHVWVLQWLLSILLW